MNLVECLAKHGLMLSPTAPGTLVMEGQGVTDLWHLSDYKVSSVSCGNVWLTPA
jgi:hypothetical protein|tara:strand:- start:321 stop:482 length:162 start_codon:yes stop_codon:yes gene_type:complete